jgi:hypothetical protein
MSKPGGYFITVNATTGTTVECMRFFQLMFSNDNFPNSFLPNCIHFINGTNWTIDDCMFQNYLGNGVLIENQVSPDGGGSNISNCSFYTYAPYTSMTGTAAGIVQYNSGGLTISGTKIIGGEYGYSMELNHGTSNLLITNCSMENLNIAINLSRQNANTGTTFSNVIITGNEFNCGSRGILADQQTSLLWIQNMVISNNVFISSNIGIQIDWMQNWIISNNVFTNEYSIILGNSPSNNDNNFNSTIQFNRSLGQSVILSNNGSPGTLNGPTYIYKSDVQSGTGAITTSASYGSFYTGNMTIAFPKTYNASVAQSTADMKVFLSQAAGGALSVGVNSISATGAQVFAIGYTNGGSVPFIWQSIGLL